MNGGVNPYAPYPDAVYYPNLGWWIPTATGTSSSPSGYPSTSSGYPSASSGYPSTSGGGAGYNGTSGEGQTMSPIFANRSRRRGAQGLASSNFGFVSTKGTDRSGSCEHAQGLEAFRF